MEFRSIVKDLSGAISKNSPTLLTGLAVTGLVTTTILGIKATPKAMSVIDDHLWKMYEEEATGETFTEWLGIDDGICSMKDRTKMLSRREILCLTWKTYLPTAALGLATIACVIGSNRISLTRNAALVSIYGITEAAFKEYRTKVVESIGKNKELKIRDDISEDRIKKKPLVMNEVIFTGKGEVMCHDSISGRYFKSDIEKIRRSVNTLNYNLRSDMFVTLNQLYDELGLSSTALGEQLGWDVDKGEIEIEYSSQLTENGEPCLVLNYTIEPKFMR